MTPEFSFCAVRLSDRKAIADDGTPYLVTNVFDAFGDETEDEHEAVVIVVRIADDCWCVIDMAEFEDATLN